ncbi:PP2C family protein-serine/threonine phosphatase [Actinoplanes teichomyceticus]|nr:protein phosphatase 2C domain-containing protein [Actinoplanes teichomyceticus]
MGGTPGPGGDAPGRGGRDCPHCGASTALDPDGYCQECGMLAGRPRDHTEADGEPVAAAVSDRGRRHHRNEDAMWLAVGADAADVVVCDGVSSSFDPDVASEVAARTAGELLARAQHPVRPARPAADEPTGELARPQPAQAGPQQAGPRPGTASPQQARPQPAQAGPQPTGPQPAQAEPEPSPTPPEPVGPGTQRAEAGPHPAEEGTEAIADPDAPTEPLEPARSEPAEPALPVAEVVAMAIQGAGAAVAALAGTGDPRRAVSNPACTIVAAAVRGPHVGFGWVGDSRAYWVAGSGPAEQLTEDDSWARHVIALGVDPRVAMNDPKAHAITAWLGADAGRITPRIGAFTARVPGHLVLCSDGLWNYLTDPADFGDAVRSALRIATGPRPLLEAARALVAYANSAGGADNITVAILPVPPPSPAEAGGDAEPSDNEPSEA